MQPSPPSKPNTTEDISTPLTDFANQWQSEFPDATLHLYALADAEQDHAMWQRLARFGNGGRALLSSAANDHSPHLLDLGPASALSSELIKVLARKHHSTAYTLLCSPLSLTSLHKHLKYFTDVKLPGDYKMVLANWDPAILGTLVGQPDDDTLHVRGPVFNPQQLHSFLQPIAAWWYLDRENRWHLVEPAVRNAPASDLPGNTLEMTQEQEDALVEAGVPDQVLYHLELNRPTLFDSKLPHAKRYRFIRAVLPSARKLGLEGMRDLVSFVALCLIYRQRIETDPQILHLLDQVQKKHLTLDEALKVMPE